MQPSHEPIVLGSGVKDDEPDTPAFPVHLDQHVVAQLRNIDGYRNSA
jgi:hypothetical protein